jgi:hypothetical protein
VVDVALGIAGVDARRFGPKVEVTAVRVNKLRVGVEVAVASEASAHEAVVNVRDFRKVGLDFAERALVPQDAARDEKRDIPR